MQKKAAVSIAMDVYIAPYEASERAPQYSASKARWLPVFV